MFKQKHIFLISKVMMMKIIVETIDVHKNRGYGIHFLNSFGLQKTKNNFLIKIALYYMNLYIFI